MNMFVWLNLNIVIIRVGIRSGLLMVILLVLKGELQE